MSRASGGGGGLAMITRHYMLFSRGVDRHSSPLSCSVKEPFRSDKACFMLPSIELITMFVFYIDLLCKYCLVFFWITRTSIWR
jgi:hypothetical protein